MGTRRVVTPVAVTLGKSVVAFSKRLILKLPSVFAFSPPKLVTYRFWMIFVICVLSRLWAVRWTISSSMLDSMYALTSSMGTCSLLMLVPWLFPLYFVSINSWSCKRRASGASLTCWTLLMANGRTRGSDFGRSVPLPMSQRSAQKLKQDHFINAAAALTRLFRNIFGRQIHRKSWKYTNFENPTKLIYEAFVFSKFEFLLLKFQ